LFKNGLCRKSRVTRGSLSVRFVCATGAFCFARKKVAIQTSASYGIIVWNCDDCLFAIHAIKRLPVLWKMKK